MKIFKKIKLYFKRKKIYKTISKSGLFDNDWYLEQYPEVRKKRGVKALTHYLEQGWKEGKNPSALFCNDVYLAIYDDIRLGGINPLMHYIKHGKNEKREIYSVDTIENYQVKESDIEFVNEAQKKSKTILLISHELSLTGAPRALLNMAIVLKKQGATPFILSLKNGAMEKEITDLGIKFVVEFLFNQKMDHGDQLLNRFISRFDTILFNTLDTVRLIKYFPFFLKQKICWLHEGCVSYNYWQRTLDLQALFSSFDKICVVGEYSKSFTATYVTDKRKLEILLYGMPDLKIAELDNVTDNKVKFLLPGTLTVRKGQMVLIKSLDSLSKEIRDQIMIYIVGPKGETVVMEAIECCPHSCVKYLGEFEHKKLMRLFSSMDVILVPSLDDPMPIVCTEAMILEKAIIVSENTGTASFIEDGVNGYKIPANNPEALAEVIENVVKRKENLHEIGKASRQIYNENFTMDIFEKHVKSLIIED